jgi:ABC-type molybdate transport system ATPase subunit
MRQRLLALVLHLQQTTSVRFIMVSHALSELAFICHEIIALSAGKIMQFGAPNLHLQQDNKHCPVSYLSLQQPQYDPQYNLIKWQLSADIDFDINIYSDALNQTDESATSYRWLINSDTITLSYEQQTQSSILNQIPVTVTHIETCEQHVIVELSVAEQQLLVKIAHLAYANLSSEDRFKPGVSMWAQLPLCSLSSNLL